MRLPLFIGVLAVVYAVNDDSLYFTRSSVKFETHLNPEDFQRAKYVMSDTFAAKRSGPETDPLLKAGLFEGDIAGLDATSARDLAGDGVARNAVLNSRRVWAGAKVPYSISSEYSSYSRTRIAAALDDYAKRTCIQFVPRSTEADYVYIFPDDGCYSMVGKSGGKQTVSLGSGCVQKGIIQHELMHAVGFFHEQSRTDRDDYIDVLYSNIQPGMESQFQKYSLNTIQFLGTRYDYGSVMHYGATAFSKNGQPTIKAKQAGVSIGQRNGFSEVDVEKLNKLYQCSEAGLVTDPYRPVVTTPSPFGQTCTDLRTDCASLNFIGYCQQQKEWMTANCAKTCNFCNGGGVVNPFASCVDNNNYCDYWQRQGHCKGAFETYMTAFCKKSCKLC